MIRFALSVLILFAFYSESKSQDEKQIVQTYNLCYPDDSHPMNNALLTNLQAYLPQINDKPCITYSVGFSYKTRVAGSEFRTSITCMDAGLANPVIYQKFDLSEAFYPVTMKLNVTVGEKTEVFEHEIQTGAVPGAIRTSQRPGKVKIEIVSVMIDQEILSRVVEKQKYISEYYTADTQIKLGFEELSQINPDSLANLDEYLDITRRNFSTIERIKDKKLYSRLNLGEDDPLNVYNRTQELHKATFEAKSSLTKQNNNLAEEYLRLGRAALTDRDTTGAINYFDKSIELDGELAGPRVEKTSIMFENGKYIQVINEVRRISENTTHDSGDRKKMSSMINFIIDTLVNQAEKENRAERYQEGLMLLDSATNICTSIQIVVCSDLIEIAKSHSWRGLLNQQILHWFALLGNDEYSEIPSTIDESFQFRSDHNRYLTTNELLYKNVRIIQDSLLHMADLYNETNPDKALEALYAAREICKTYSVISCPETLDAKFAVAFKEAYRRMLVNAGQALNDSLPNKADSIQVKAKYYCRAQNIKINKKHKQIIQRIAEQRYHQVIKKLSNVKVADKQDIELLDSALSIRQRGNVTIAPGENFIKTRLVTDYISMLTEKSQKMEQAGQTAIAGNLMNEIQWAIERFQINMTEEKMAFIQSLQERIGSKACYDKQQQFEVLTHAAQLFKDRHDYPHALQSYQKALRVIEKNPSCVFNKKQIQQSIDKIDEVAAYQKAQQRCRWHAVNNDFHVAVSVYDSISRNPIDSLLQANGLSYESIDEFALRVGYMPFIHHVAKKLAERGQPEKSFALVTRLYQKKYERDLSAEAQEALGESLAKEFYIQDPSQESYARLEGYVLDKKWSKPFTRSFQKKWKEIQSRGE